MADHTALTPDAALSPTAQTHDAAALGARSIDAVTGMARQNMEKMLSVAQGTAQGFEAMMGEITTFSRESIERTAQAAQAMKATTSPNALLKLQADYAHQQAKATMTEMAKLSQMMIKTAGRSLAVSMQTAGLRGSDQ